MHFMFQQNQKFECVSGYPSRPASTTIDNNKVSDDKLLDGILISTVS